MLSHYEIILNFFDSLDIDNLLLFGLALFIVFILAWVLGRRSAFPNLLTRGEVPRDYLRGLNYLLNEQQDKAVDVFIKILELDSETVETHLALGNLFRRRGEVDRAIRIHQNLIARPQLDKAVRVQALHELAQDYMSAGVLDRAERLFQEVIGLEGNNKVALKSLLEIFQQEKEWKKAIEIAEELLQFNSSYSENIAHYYCELANSVIRDETQYYRLLKKALSVRPHHIRALLLIANYTKQQGNYKSAIRQYKHVLEQGPEFAAEFLQDMIQCYEAQGEQGALVSFMQSKKSLFANPKVLVIAAKYAAKHMDIKKALGLLTKQLREYPSLEGLNCLVDLYSQTVHGSALEDLSILQGLLHRLLANRPDYCCNKCGFSGRQLHWQCPSCKSWDTIKPIFDKELV